MACGVKTKKNHGTQEQSNQAAENDEREGAQEWIPEVVAEALIGRREHQALSNGGQIDQLQGQPGFHFLRKLKMKTVADNYQMW